ncbi:MAG: hypothetical protein U0J65_09005 [Christensenellales bacterium]|nr:hypothetical protein [Christensenellales bacterium]
MLRKLMKHELRATARVMGPMMALVLAAAVGGNIATYRLLEMDNNVLNALGILLNMVFVLAIAAMCIVAFVLMVQRFYKNLLRDEGYLMMTLPVSVHQHIWAKLLTTLLWWLAVMVVVVLAMFILVFRVDVVKELFTGFTKIRFEDLMYMNGLPNMIGFFAEILLMMAVSGACVCLEFYAALAVGHSFTHHKDAMSVVMFFALSILWSAVQSALGYLMVKAGMGLDGVVIWMQSLNRYAQMHLTMLGMSAMMLVPAAVWYAVTAHFLKHRLNLG